MIGEIPLGVKIGEMQAPLEWVLNHSVRFVGAIIIRIEGGEGVILIQRGIPLLYYIHHESRELRGRAAEEYLRSQRVIWFALHRYTVEEMAHAATILRITAEPLHQVPVSLQTREREQEVPPSSEIPKIANSISPEMGAVPEQEVGVLTAMVKSTPAIGGFESFGESPDELVGRMLFGQILTMPGVISVSVFNEDLSLLSIGEVNVESLTVMAGDLLESARGIARMMHMGEFVQMTLQVPGGNVIIAPFHGEYLCILTSPEINLGRIRRLLREIQKGQGGLIW
ncbi:MAG: roadblock/LC7 domain-containing protein [Methanomicrobiales archaeon]|nr:roadblock/LC7 domain-containing protein [Methanomicrobiales archaeon]